MADSTATESMSYPLAPWNRPEASPVFNEEVEEIITDAAAAETKYMTLPSATDGNPEQERGDTPDLDPDAQTQCPSPSPTTPNPQSTPESSHAQLPSSEPDDEAAAADLLAAGSQHHANRNFQAALESFTLAHAFYLSTSDERGQANALYGLARAQAHDRTTTTSAASDTFKQAIALYESLHDTPGTARASHGLAKLYYAQSKFADAAPLLVRAAELFAQTEDVRAHACTVKLLGDICLARGEFKEAEAAFGLAQGIFASVDDDALRTGCVVGLGRAFMGLARSLEVDSAKSAYHMSGGLFVQALKTYEQLGDRKQVAEVLCCLGKVSRSVQDFDKAAESYANAGSVYEQLGNQLGHANALRGLGDVQRSQGQFDAAEESYTLAHAIYLSLANTLGQANALLGLAQVYSSKRQYADARSSYKEAAVLYAQIQNALGQANSLDGLAKVCFDQDDYSDSKLYHSQAREIYQKLNREPSELSNVQWRAMDAFEEMLDSPMFSHKIRLSKEGRAWKIGLEVSPNEEALGMLLSLVMAQALFSD